MNKLVLEVLSHIGSMLQTKNQIIENKIPEKWIVKADYEMIKVVVRNLITNAIKFSPSNSTIVIEGIEEDRNFIFKFIDHGMGIAPEVLKTILCPDFLNSTSGTDNENGTGIGLKLTKDFVEKNGGTISVTSKQNEGSVFEITLPKG